MAYTDVITLADAKLYLRIDDTLTDDDAQITRMISSALSYVEKWTNVLVYARNKDYLIVDGIIRVYDYPINSVVSPDEADMTITRKTLYTIYEYNTDTDLTLNVGYANPDDVPQELKDVALEIIDNMYYRNDWKNMGLSPLSIDILNKHKRFII